MSQIWVRSAKPDDIRYLVALHKIVTGEPASPELHSGLSSALEQQQTLPKNERFMFVAGVCGLYAAYAQLEIVDASRQLQKLVTNPRYPEVVDTILTKAQVTSVLPGLLPQPESLST